MYKSAVYCRHDRVSGAAASFFWLKTARFAVIFVAAIIEMTVVEEY
jgi:hypothetical protein